MTHVIARFMRMLASCVYYARVRVRVRVRVRGGGVGGLGQP